MSTPPRLTDEGLEVPTANEWLTSIRESIDDRLDESLPYSQNDVLGALTVEMAVRFGELSEALKAVDDSRSVQTAGGVHLEDLVGLLGITRDSARPSTISDQLFLGDFQTVVPAGTKVKGGGPQGKLEWSTDNAVELGWRVLPGDTAGSLPTGTYKLTVSAATTSVTVSYSLTSAGDRGALLRAWQEKLQNSQMAGLVDLEIRDVGADGDDDEMYIRSAKGFDLSVSRTIPSGATVTLTKGVAIVGVEAAEPGPYLAAAQAVGTLVEQISGVDATLNLVDANPGTEKASDSELRMDHGRRLQRNATAASNAIRAALEELDLVEAAAVPENDTNTSQTVQGLQLPESSVGVVVWPDSFSDSEKDILAKTVYRGVTHGIEVAEDTNFGRFSRTVETAGETTKTVYVHFASERTVDVTVQATIKGEFAKSDIRPQIVATIEGYLAERSVSEDVHRLTIFGLIDDIEAVESVSTLTLDTFASDVSIASTEIATPGTIDVTL